MNNLLILIVDDRSDVRKIIINSLKQVEYDESGFSEASTYEEALQKIAKGNFDIVITDWDVQNEDGSIFMVSLRKLPGKKGLPVLVTYYRPRFGEIDTMLASGANGAILKPFTPGEIFRAIERIVKKA